MLWFCSAFLTKLAMEKLWFYLFLLCLHNWGHCKPCTGWPTTPLVSIQNISHKNWINATCHVERNHSQFFLNYFPHIWYCFALNIFFPHINSQIDPVCSVMFVERISRHQETLAKKELKLVSPLDYLSCNFCDLGSGYTCKKKN